MLSRAACQLSISHFLSDSSYWSKLLAGEHHASMRSKGCYWFLLVDITATIYHLPYWYLFGREVCLRNVYVFNSVPQALILSLKIDELLTWLIYSFSAIVLRTFCHIQSNWWLFQDLFWKYLVWNGGQSNDKWVPPEKIFGMSPKISFCWKCDREKSFPANFYKGKSIDHEIR